MGVGTYYQQQVYGAFATSEHLCGVMVESVRTALANRIFFETLSSADQVLKENL